MGIPLDTRTVTFPRIRRFLSISECQILTLLGRYRNPEFVLDSPYDTDGVEVITEFKATIDGVLSMITDGVLRATTDGVQSDVRKNFLAMLRRYRTAAPDIVEAVETPELLYGMLAMVRIMNDFHHLELPDGTETAVKERIKTDVQRLLTEE